MGRGCIFLCDGTNADALLSLPFRGYHKILYTLYLFPDTPEFHEKQDALFGLIDHLKVFYKPFFNIEALAPFSYYRQRCELLSGKLDFVKFQLQEAGITPSLKLLLVNWIGEMVNGEKSIRFSFKSMFYFERVIQGLSLLSFQQSDTEDQIVICLNKLNFNHLTFYVYRQNVIREKALTFHSQFAKLSYLNQQKAAALSSPEDRSIIYSSDWPSLKTMLIEWLREEINLLEFTNSHERLVNPIAIVQKVSLNTSVAHLACLIRLFYEEDFFSQENLTSIFNFFSEHFSSKRQTSISPGSLSKEYYSIDQHTAARVRDLLQKMVVRINRNFFPVLAAIGTIVGFYQGIC